MAMQKFATAASAIAASATSNVMAGNQSQQANYARTIKRIAVAESDNTPVIGEETWILKFGVVEIARGRSVLLGTAGPEFAYPDVFDDVMTLVPQGTVVNLEVTNTDSGAAHGAIVAIEWDRQ